MTFKFNKDMSFKGHANSRQIRHFPQINKNLKREKWPYIVRNIE